MSSSTGKAIVCHDTLQNGGWKMEDITVRPLKEGELLVEMVASGVCHTDLIAGGIPAGSTPIAFYPRVVGHEGSGYVRDVGPGVKVAAPGDPVLLSFTFCGNCEICKAGYHAHCTAFMPLNFGGPYPVFKLASDSTDGEHNISGNFFGQSSFANLSIVSQQSVVNAKDLVKDRSELELFSPLGCGIQTGAGSVTNVAKAGPSDSICVMGLGGVGLSAIMAAKISECRQIIAIDRVASRLELARELGATHVIDGDKLPEGKTLVEAVKEIADGLGPNITIDTSGAPKLVDAGHEFTRNCGKYVQVGTTPFEFQLSSINAFNFMVSGKQWIGAIEGQAYPPEYVPKMVKWYREGKLPLEKFVKFLPAEDFQQGLQAMHDGSMVKPILRW